MTELFYSGIMTSKVTQETKDSKQLAAVIDKLPRLEGSEEPTSGAGLAGMAVSEPSKATPEAQVDLSGPPPLTAPGGLDVVMARIDGRMDAMERATMATMNKFQATLKEISEQNIARGAQFEASVKQITEQDKVRGAQLTKLDASLKQISEQTNARVEAILDLHRQDDTRRSVSPVANAPSLSGESQVVVGVFKELLDEIKRSSSVTSGGSLPTVRDADAKFEAAVKNIPAIGKVPSVRAMVGTKNLPQLKADVAKDHTVPVFSLLAVVADSLEVHYKILALKPTTDNESLQRWSAVYLLYVIRAASNALSESDPTTAFKTSFALVPQAVRGWMSDLDQPSQVPKLGELLKLGYTRVPLDESVPEQVSQRYANATKPVGS